MAGRDAASCTRARAGGLKLVAPRDYGRSAPNPRGICLWWLSGRKRRRQRGRILRSGSASPPSSLEVPPWVMGPWLSPGGHSSHFLSPSPLLVPGVSTPGAVGPCVGAGSLFQPQSLAEAGATQVWGQEQRRAATWGHPKSQGHPERADAAAPGLAQGWGTKVCTHGVPAGPWGSSPGAVQGGAHGEKGLMAAGGAWGRPAARCRWPCGFGSLGTWSSRVWFGL